jgi:fimbrial isopeptide formation D2 family protein
VDADNEKTEYGAALASDITLPERTAGYKIVHKSGFYTTKMYVCPTLFLRSTNKVYSFVQDNMLKNVNTLIKNNAVLSVDGEEAVDSKRADQGGAQICSYELKTDESYLYVSKKCAKDEKDSAGNDYYSVDSQAGTQEFPVLISAWGINRAGSTKLMQSGVFYDLLPYNFTVDKSTVFVQGRKEKNTQNSMHAHSYNKESTNNNNFPSSLYSVEFVENWEGSGRTMMIVTITGIPDNLSPSYTNAINGFNVFYKMKTTMSNVMANGTTQMNYVSFTDTTENQTVPVARYNALNTLDPKAIPYYKSINDAHQEFTAYTSDATHCKMPSQYVTGFNSSVKTEGVFMMEDKTVGLASDYSYNVTFTDGESEAENVVIYDVIENNYNGSNCEWKGSFESINISAIQNMEDINSKEGALIYCEPKVYYLVKDGEVTPEDLDLINNPAVWSATVPSDKSKIKAVAIDCRTASNGGNFTLPAKKALSFNVSMHSPDTSEENDLITYNEAVVKALVGGQPNSSRAITRLTLHFAEPLIGKESFPESGKDAEHRAGAVNGSTIDYTITVTNPDSFVPIRNIAVEDLLDTKLKVNSIPKVSKGDETPVSINSAAGITYSIEPQESGRDKFTATISRLDPGETMTIIVPATVTDAPNGYTIDNTAYITSANGNSLNIRSDTTYHYVTNTQAKIKKVDANGDGLAGASLQILSSDKSQVVIDNITSTTDIVSVDLVPGDYVLHEVSTPNDAYYKLAADIPFSIDVEGINKVNNKSVSYVEMVDEPAYQIIFHENRPDYDDEIFKVYGPADLESGKLKHFYDIPSFAGDEYIFAGWYHTAGYTTATSESEVSIPVNFESDTYSASSAENPSDYHLYAKWIKVGKIASQATEDTYNYGDAGIRGFGLVGVEIRDPGMNDPNYNTNETDTTPGGLRFITSLSESLISAVDSLSGQKVEYGYVVATEENIKKFTANYKVSDLTKYKLEYNGRNVNGIDTTGLNENNERFETDANDNKVLARKDLTAENDYVYVTNVNCTKGTGSIKNDHRNFSNYRLYTLIVTYEGDDADKKNQKIDARAYIRYTDANGKVRVFYNNYKKNLYYGGCLSSFNQAKSLARPTDSEWIG